MVAFLTALPFLKARNFPVYAVHLDGTNDYMNRGAGLTGAADASTGIFHCFFKTSAGGYLFDDTNQTTEIAFLSPLRFRVTDGGSRSLTINGDSNYTDDAWHSILWSWSTNFSAGNKICHLYVDDIASSGTKSDPSTAFNVDYTQPDWMIGHQSAGLNKYAGDLAQFYFAPGQFLDFSIEANRRKFITASNKPVNLGATGALPTGSQPIIFLDNPFSSFGTNKGSGGNFTVTGALTAASTTPSA